MLSKYPFNGKNKIDKIVSFSRVKEVNIGNILTEFATGFKDKIDADYQLKIQLKIKDINELYHIQIMNGLIDITRVEDEDNDVSFFTTTKTLFAIYHGEMTAFTAAGKAQSSDEAPLDWKITDNAAANKMHEIYYFLLHFFNRYEPEKTLLGEEYARVVHGAYAIPLYYYPGFRSAWYQINKGQRMNEPGDTNPFPQAVVIIEGKGLAKIGQKTVQVQKNESYYIPPQADHVFWTEEQEPLILLWFAWGKGA